MCSARVSPTTITLSLPNFSHPSSHALHHLQRGKTFPIRKIACILHRILRSQNNLMPPVLPLPHPRTSFPSLSRLPDQRAPTRRLNPCNPLQRCPAITGIYRRSCPCLSPCILELVRVLRYRYPRPCPFIPYILHAFHSPSPRFEHLKKVPPDHPNFKPSLRPLLTSPRSIPPIPV